MEKSFWLEKWRKNEIGFHNSEAHPLLVKHLHRLKLEKGDRLFLPLCGKTLDIGWLLGEGYRIVGAELSEAAVIQLFEQLAMTPQIEELGELKKYYGDGVEVFVGDIFELTESSLGAVDGIYDRAALVALPESMRSEYANHLIKITRAAPQLLISFDYDQNQLPGPPFCVNDSAIRALYEAGYRVEKIDSVPVEGGLKGKVAADEVVWMLEF
ncbi:thiopurine S-methyltransferase [Microbulbifer sp. HZ11]|uniref:thiopurine S-methyltransferase n=1 Tax=unclassified Microbulbifer TaxID=2619833 RepID=UPI0005B79E51|nr:thiopurine S-methyltransferase [Microbulbifer sp. HZ11]